jgi:hypothetical protein
MKEDSNKTWLLIIHQIPPKPDYFRVKIWRRLQQVGAVAIKPSVYVLPNSESSYEDFSWILKEITQGGGDANLSEVRFLEGLTDDQVVALFQDARKSDYEKLIEEVHAVRDELGNFDTNAGDVNAKFKAQIGKLQKRLDEVIAVDFFDAPQRIAAKNAISAGIARLKGFHNMAKSPKIAEEFIEKTWVTRKNVYVDRMASAWLITRFIDKKASFKFVGAKKHAPQKDEVRFDMFDAEFSHEGDMCTFETLIQRFGVSDKALQTIAEIVHDIDMKDGKYQRPEIHGISVVLSGITAARHADEERLRRGQEVFDDLYAYLKKMKTTD